MAEPKQTDDLMRRLRAGRVLPIVGASLTYDLVLATDGKPLAQAWAEDLDLPLLKGGPVDRIAEHEYYRTGDNSRVNQDYLLFLKRLLLSQAQSDPEVPGDVVKEIVASISELAFTMIAKELGYPKLGYQSRNPLSLLANLPLSIYLTTSVHGLLQDALRWAGKDPRTAICNWNEVTVDLVRQEHRFDPNYRPTVATPLVFHVYGHEDYPESLVLSRNDYLSFLESIARNRGRDAQNPVIPLVVLSAWATSSILCLGLQPDTLEFKALWMGLSSSQRKRTRGTFQYSGVPEQEAIRQYVRQYLSDRDLDVYWGAVDEFLSSLLKA